MKVQYCFDVYSYCRTVLCLSATSFKVGRLVLAGNITWQTMLYVIYYWNRLQNNLFVIVSYYIQYMYLWHTCKISQKIGILKSILPHKISRKSKPANWYLIVSWSSFWRVTNSVFTSCFLDMLKQLINSPLKNNIRGWIMFYLNNLLQL